ncbi:MAG: DUF4340 domain-containing protein [Acidobacteria bacterium]|nr:MAG: DUF4340 domain-containing protein [Acidobacteriota bacterium]
MVEETTPVEAKPELNLTKTLAGAALLLAVISIVFVFAPRTITPSAFLDQGEPFFPDFTDPNVAMTLEVIEFDEETAAARPFKVTNQNGIWTIPSHHNYAADGEDRLAETAAGVMTINKDDFRSDNVSDHEVLGVIDPLDETAASLLGRGKRVTMRGENDVVLADIIIGSEVEGRDGFHFVRMPDQKRVYAAKVDVDISTKFEDWIESDLLKVERSKIDHIVLRDYSINEQSLMVDERDTVTLDKEDNTWAANRMDPNQEVDSTKISDLLREVDDLKIVGVRPKPKGIDNRLSGLTVSRQDVLSLQSRGYYMTRTGDLLSNEGELQVRTSEGVFYTLRFGEILYGSGEAISAGAESTGDEESGPGENRYLFITADFDGSALPEPPPPGNRDFEDKEGDDLTDDDKENKELADAHKSWEDEVKKGQETAEELSQRFAPWYYVIASDSFDKMHLNRGDLIKEKESTDE